MQKKQRIEWLDAIKGFAIIAVVFGHVLLGYVENDAFPSVGSALQLIMNWIYTWHMPLFFVVSGITFYLSCLKEGVDRKRIRRQTVNLLLIYLIFVIALCVLKVLFSSFVDNKIAVSEIFINILLPDTLMWYLWVLIIYYLLFSVFEHFVEESSGDKDRIRLMLLGVLTVISYIASVVNKSFGIRMCLKNLVCYAVFFYLGVWYARYIGRGALRRQRKREMISYAVVIAYILFCLFVGERYVSLPDTVSAFIEILNAISVSLACLYGFSRIAAIGKNRFLIRFGEHSLVIYLLHTYFVTALKVLFIRVGIENWVLALGVTTVAPLAITYFIAVIVPYIPVVRYVFRPIDLFQRSKKRKGEIK